MQKLKIILQFNYKFIILFVFVFFYVLMFTKIIHYKSKYLNDNYFVKGKIINYSINGNKLSLDIKAAENIKGTYYIKSLDELNNLKEHICLGCTITFNGLASQPLKNTIPNTFNYQKYLYNKKIYKLFKINSFKIKQNNNVLSKIKDYFYKRTENSQNSDYLKIFILGDKSLINNEEYSYFQENGIAHLLAISGMHIGVLLKILDVILRKIKIEKKIGIISCILIFYAFLTNFTASILRASLFYILLNLKKILNINISNFKILIITAMILIIFNPFMVYDLGFIYSFVITGGIILSNNLIKGNYFKQLLLLSIISFLFSLPITINLNYEINLTSILANLIFVPYISIIVYPLSLLSFILPLFMPIFDFSITLLKQLNYLFNYVQMMIVIPKLNFGIIISYYILLLFCLKNLKFLSSLVMLIIVVKIMPKLNNHYYLYYLDVGQGDSAVLISPHQSEVFMIDTGGKIDYPKEKWEIGSKNYHLSDNTIKFLKSLGLRKIDYLLLSHGDQDHLGETLNIMKKFQVKNIVLNNGPINSLENKIKQEGKIVPKIISSYFPFINLNNSINEDENFSSAVYYTKIYNYGLLFMGDAPKEIEENLVSQYNLKVNILKIGHHGSNTSSSENFIKNINFDYGIISSGRNNIYGHPSIETINTLKKYHRLYLNTQTSGTIEFIFRPKTYTIIEYPP